MAGPVIDVEKLSVGLPLDGERKFAVRDLSFSVGPGEVLCIVGESGSGKSLTARAIMRIVPAGLGPIHGAIRLAGEDILKAGPARMREIRGAEIAMIFQEPMTALNPLMTCGKQVQEVFETHCGPVRGGYRAEVLRIFRDVGLPHPEYLYSAFPHQLSGGQRQRVMIAMALALEPKLLLADEPTTALDVTTQAQILKLIRDMQQRINAAVVFITHDFGVVSEIADHILVMQHGVAVEYGKAEDVLNRPKHSYTRALLAVVPKLDPKPPLDFSASPVAFSATALRKVHGRRKLFSGRPSVTALDGVTLQVRRGETLGIVGESGSGKSTLARVCARLEQPDAGSIMVGDLDAMSVSAEVSRKLRKQVQIVFQDPFGSLNPRFSIEDILVRGPMMHGVKRADAVRKARALLDLVGLSQGALPRFPHQFSGGQRQRVSIARALAMDPTVLILDEPVSALDVSLQNQILDLLMDLQTRFDLASIFITHDLRVASRICDRIAIMKNGSILEIATSQDIFERPAHAYTRELIGAMPGKELHT